MFYILNATCSDYALASILGIIKRVIDVIRIVVPIMLILGGTITFVKGIFNPEQSDKTKKAFLNQIISAVIIMLLPLLINTSMAVISTYGEVGLNESGNTITFDISSCWTQAEAKGLEMQSTTTTTKSINDEATNTKTNNNSSNKNNNNKNSNSKNNQNSSSSNNNNNTSNNNFQTTHNKFVLVGDSRFVGQENYNLTNSKTTYIAKVSQGLTYLKNQETKMKSYDSSKTAYVINMGVNDLYNANNYVTYINDLAKNYKGDIYFLSVNPVDEAKSSSYGYKVSNKDIESFNKTLKNGLKNVTYIDSYNYLKQNGYDTADGIHYTQKTYEKIYNYINSQVK